MDKDVERSFLETLSRALVSLPFDVKVLLEAVTEPDLDPALQELAAATAVHVINPKDGNLEPYLRHAEDVVLLRLCLAKIVKEGGQGAAAFRDRFAENYTPLDGELALFGRALGADVIAWLDGKWPTLLKVVFAKKKISQFVGDEELGAFLYEEGLRFSTDYPITEKTLVGRMKQAQPIVDHLLRKREQDRKKIAAP